MAKSSHKKKHAKIIGQHKHSQQGTWWIIPIVIIIAAIIVVGLVSNWTYYINSGEKPIEIGAVLVTVNGEPIYQEQLDKQWNALSVQSKMQLTREDLLDQLVQERLLLQEAEKQNIVVEDKEVEEYLSFQITSTGMTEEQLEELLTAQGTTIEEVKEVYKKQLALAKLFDQTVNVTIDPSIEEIEAYYEDNKEQFFAPEQVRVRHLLVSVNDQFNETWALERVEELEVEMDAKDNENFCELVTNYTQDTGSKDTCGEYTFPVGVMVPEFEEASFAMEIGDRETVKSQFGYHIILKMDEIDEGYLGLNDSLADYPGQPTIGTVIAQQLTQQKAKAVFDEYVNELRNQSVIEYEESITAKDDLTNEEGLDINETIFNEGNTTNETTA